MISKLTSLLFLIVLWSSTAQAQATNYCNNQMYQPFVTTSGTPTAASLQATQKGTASGTWATVFTPPFIQYSSVDMPSLVAPGRMCGDSVTYTNNAGDGSIVETFDGNADFENINYTLASPVTSISVVTMVNEDFAQTDGSKIDAIGIVVSCPGNPCPGTIAFNMYGNPGSSRYFSLELTGASVANINWNPSQSCPCQVTLSAQFSTTVTGFTSASLLVRDKKGATLGSLSGTGTTANISHGTAVKWGDQCNCSAPTSGKHIWFAHPVVSLDGSVPEQFCLGASPTWTSSPDNATLQTCIDNISSGDTVNVLSGTATWSTAEVTNFNNKVPMNIIGQTVVTGWGTPTPSANDTVPGSSTVIYANHTAGNGVSLGLVVPRSGCANPSTVPGLRLSGLTLMETIVGPNGSVAILDANNSWPPSQCRFRVDNIHQVALAGSPTGDMLVTQDVYGLIDRFWSQNHSANTIVHIQHFGDAINKGFAGWNTPLAFGTDQAVYVENYTVQDDFCNTSGAGDGGQGARAVYRHGYELNGHIGFHGTDSGSELSMFSVEQYNNTFVNNACTSTALTNMTSRGGTYIHYNDSFSGSASWAGDKLQELRADPSVAAGNDWSSWGGALGFPWVLNSAVLGNGGMQQVTTSGADWQASHSYTCSQAVPCAIIPTSNNTGNFNYASFASCISGGSRPNPFNQGAGTTTPDNTCNWINGWGTTSTGANAGRCPLNKDIFVTSVANCPAGDQSGTLGFFDGPPANFGYPGANQIGRSNNGPGTGETLNPDYQWLNSGIPNPGFFAQNDPNHIFIQECRDYYQQQGSATFTGACSAGNGVGVGTFSQLSATCSAGLGGNTPGVGFWATDKNTLYVCNPANTWKAYYTPLVYPHPLAGGSGGSPIITICPAINFNFANTGTTNQVLCSMQNVGGGTLTWTSITVSGAPFSLSPGNCTLTGGSLAPQGTCAFVVIFSPTTQGPFSGTVTVNDNSSGSPHTVPLSGNGASMAPAAQVFASNLTGCKQAAPLQSTWCFTGDGHIYYSTCTPLVCAPFRNFYLVVQGLAQ